MPKLIENAKEIILECADCELAEKGYESLTIRSIADKCGIAVGTVYNYFHAKDEIVFFVMRRDWDSAMSRMSSIAEEAAVASADGGAKLGAETAVETLLEILSRLHDFTSKYKSVWRLIAAAPHDSKSDTVKAYNSSEFIAALEAKIALVVSAAFGEGSQKERYSDFLARFIMAAFTRFAMDDELEKDNLRRVLKNILQA